MEYHVIETPRTHWNDHKGVITCQRLDCDKAAVICEHIRRGSASLSFLYYCPEHTPEGMRHAIPLMQTETATVQAKHTPGPWTVSADPDTGGVFIVREIREHEEELDQQADALNDEGKEVEADAIYMGSGDVRGANARLIAAAPEMLEALTALVKDDAARGAVSTYAPNILKAARQAIARAEGGQQ